MKRSYSLKRTLSWMFCLITILIPLSAWGVDIDYSDFSDLSALTLGPRAQELNPNPENVLKLISGTWQRGGSAFLFDPVDLIGGYSTQFSFQITNLIGGGADWLWFIVTKVPVEVNSDLPDSVIVEFDIYNNGGRDNYDGNHIGLHYDASWMVIQPLSKSFKNGEVWNVWIDYEGMIMNIYASMDSVKPVSPYISLTVKGHVI